MPILTFYAYKGTKHHRIALHTIYDWPSDWAYLKELLTECAMTLWNEHNLATVLMTLELHLPGKFTWKTKPGAYSPMRVRFRREVEWSGRVCFNHKTQETTVDQCVFGPHLMLMSSDYYAERGIRYRVPSLIPKMHQNLGDPKSLLMEPSGVRYADYSRQPRGPYDFSEEQQKKRLPYEPLCERKYLPEGLKIREESKEKPE